jgi:hypothetical protein
MFDTFGFEHDVSNSSQQVETPRSTSAPWTADESKQRPGGIDTFRVQPGDQSRVIAAGSQA